MQVDIQYVWVQVPCAADSGACAHVTPAEIFGILPTGKEKLAPKYFPAGGSPIKNLGTQTVKAELDNGVELTTMFDVGKITRPLLSVHMMIENGHEVKFPQKENSINLKGTNEKIHMRMERRLFMLDLWAECLLN